MSGSFGTEDAAWSGFMRLPKKRYEWQKRDGEWHLVLVEVEVHTPSATITVEVSEEREVDDGV
tara:strand:- start:3015 stop:3203 length:189 start_codon:yes stop_codon:yes gene_type:complete